MLVMKYKRGRAAEAYNDAEAGKHFAAALKADPRAFLAAYNLGVVADRQGVRGASARLLPQGSSDSARSRVVGGRSRCDLRSARSGA